jgi:hypothetical protein
MKLLITVLSVLEIDSMSQIVLTAQLVSSMMVSMSNVKPVNQPIINVLNVPHLVVTFVKKTESSHTVNVLLVMLKFLVNVLNVPTIVLPVLVPLTIVSPVSEKDSIQTNVSVHTENMTT